MRNWNWRATLTLLHQYWPPPLWTKVLGRFARYPAERTRSVFRTFSSFPKFYRNFIHLDKLWPHLIQYNSCWRLNTWRTGNREPRGGCIALPTNCSEVPMTGNRGIRAFKVVLTEEFCQPTFPSEGTTVAVTDRSIVSSPDLEGPAIDHTLNAFKFRRSAKSIASSLESLLVHGFAP